MLIPLFIAPCSVPVCSVSPARFFEVCIASSAADEISADASPWQHQTGYSAARIVLPSLRAMLTNAVIARDMKASLRVMNKVSTLASAAGRA